jgi:Ca-activated chloride channel family protein
LHFEFPWLWLALPPLLLWVWWFWRKSYAQMGATGRTASFVLRAAIVALLLAALARPILVHTTSSQNVLFLLDVSRSISKDNLESGMADIDRLAKEAVKQGHRVSVIAFADQPRLLIDKAKSWDGWNESQRDLIEHESVLPSLNSQLAKLASENGSKEAKDALKKRIDAIAAFQKEVVGERTDAHAALRLAENCGEVGEAKTMYLLTDANFNRGSSGTSWQESFDAASTTGYSIHTIALDKPTPPEVAATELTLPSGIRVNQGFSAEVRVASNVATKAKLVVFRDGFALAEQPHELKPGTNALTLPGLFFRDKGFHTIEVAVRAEQDTGVENNRVKAVAVVAGEMRVLYVDSEEAQQSYLSSALALEGVQVDSRPSAGVPQNLEDLLGYDAFILSNVPADRLTLRQMQMIRTYVQDFGGGFIMLGGDQSFGLGGYFNTPVEEVLPVTMPIQKDLNRPSIAICLVMDKSGSMEGVKMQLAKRAAIATSEAINPRDQVGIVGFDAQSDIILELTSAGDHATIADRVAGIDAGGGTFIYPALEDAHTMLEASNARKKHIILMTDGVTQGFGYQDLAQLIASDGITISTVGIGEDADVKLLEQIASAGGGRSYFTNDFYSIPQIFTREALRASKSMLIERLVTTSKTADDEAINEIDADELPPLGGYVATSPRDAAKTILISDAGDPILAKWRCGLGRTAAFTSDTKPRWAEDWIRWEGFAKFWAQLVRSVAGRDVMKDVSVEVAQEARDEGVRLTAEVRDAAGAFVNDRPLELTAFDEQAHPFSVLVKHEGPGLFSSTVPQGEFGQFHQFAWRLPVPSSPRTTAQDKPGASGGPEAAAIPFGYVYSFSPEFRTIGVDQTTLDQIKSRHAGEVYKTGDAALKIAEHKSTEQTRLWPLLLTLALLLIPLDILVRRLA